MKHDCQETELLISGYLDGELTQSDRQRVDLILEDCIQCTETHQEMKKYREGVGDIPLDKLTKKVKSDLNKDFKSIVFHDAYQYFENRFDLNVLGAFTVNTDVMPGAEQLAEIREIIEHDLSLIHI